MHLKMYTYILPPLMCDEFVAPGFKISPNKQTLVRNTNRRVKYVTAGPGLP
jgi:hypothetical protein